MVCHIVIFELVSDDKDTLQFMVSELRRLKDLPYCESFDLSTNIIYSGIKGHVVLFSQYTTQESLDGYMKDSLHREVIKKTTPLIKNKTILDFQY